MSSEDAAPAPSAGRPRLNLKPRDPAAAARLEVERKNAQAAKNPFGAAKPREAVIAAKLGKTEEEVLKEEVSKEKLHLRLSGPQLDEKREAEAALKDIEEALALEEDAGKQAELQAGVAAAQQKLDDLMTAFAKATLETALSGGAPRVSQIRALQAEQAGMGGGDGGRYNNQAQQYGAPAGGGGGGSFGGRDFNEGGFGGGRGGGGAGGGGGGRGFGGYNQQRAGGGGGGGGGFSDGYQQGGGGGGGGRGYNQRGGSGRLPEWATDDASADSGFYDAPAATSAFIASGGYAGAAAPAPAPGGGGRGRGGRGGGGGGRGGGGGGRGYGNGGYESGAGGGFGGRGLGGEIEFTEDSSFGAGQDRF